MMNNHGKTDLNVFIILYVNVSKNDKAKCRNVKLYCGAVISTIINKQWAIDISFISVVRQDNIVLCSVKKEKRKLKIILNFNGLNYGSGAQASFKHNFPIWILHWKFCTLTLIFPLKGSLKLHNKKHQEEKAIWCSTVLAPRKPEWMCS